VPGDGDGRIFDRHRSEPRGVALMAFLLDTIVLSELRKKRKNEPKVQGC
jgi:hypothetical protein